MAPRWGEAPAALPTPALAALRALGSESQPRHFPASPLFPCRLPHRRPLRHDGRAHRSHKGGADLQGPGQQGELGIRVCQGQERCPGEAAPPQHLRTRWEKETSHLAGMCHRQFSAPEAGRGDSEVQDCWQGREDVGQSLNQPWAGVTGVQQRAAGAQGSALLCRSRS